MSCSVKVTDTSLRDGQQSIWATRLRIEDILPIAEKMDRAGFYSMEVWGGATFDSCLRYLNEDPWKRLNLIKERVVKTPLQMLLRGRNLVGYKHYPPDVVEAFIIKSIESGISIVRIFDALNDTNNMVQAIEVTRKQGAHPQAAMCYTTSPVHTADAYIDLARKLQELGAQSICIKDMAGILLPTDAFLLVSQLRKALRIPVQIHSHCTSGMASTTYLMAIKAGASIIDTATSPLSSRTSLPATETMVVMLRNTQWDTGLDLAALSQIAKYFEGLRSKYLRYETSLVSPDINVLNYQLPGGMISNLEEQLKEQGAIDRLEKVLAEVPQVRKDLGYPPLVTPTSQIVGCQALLNVMMGERYKVITNEVKNYVRGEYGSPPVPICLDLKERVEKEALERSSPPPNLREVKETQPEIGADTKQALSYILFPNETLRFLRSRREEFSMIDNTAFVAAISYGLFRGGRIRKE
ncbi:MAG: pyruvate carboxylase subunit B [Candidatus Bathyarchaeia archaeon]